MAFAVVTNGCTVGGAPTFTLFGSYFPAWMFCATIGVFVGFLARFVLVATQLSEVLPLQLGVCTSAGMVVGLLTWLVCFGR